MYTITLLMNNARNAQHAQLDRSRALGIALTASTIGQNVSYTTTVQNQMFLRYLR